MVGYHINSLMREAYVTNFKLLLLVSVKNLTKNVEINILPYSTVVHRKIFSNVTSI